MSLGGPQKFLENLKCLFKEPVHRVSPAPRLTTDALKRAFFVVYCGTHWGAPPGGCTVSAGPKVLYEFGPFRVDPDKQVLLRDGKPVPVTSKAFETLLILIRN